ncbi:MAG: tyrosine-type recombinase/integrase [Xanthobacteraceae bacterium]
MRTLRDSRLDTPTARLKLKVRSKPYWRLIEPNLHQGYRRLKGRDGSWLRRRYLGDGQYQHEWIGHADDNTPADGQTVLNFTQAQNKCRGRPAVKAGPYTVRAAVEDYLAWLQAERKSGHDARRRAEALILPALGDRKCEALTAEEINAWRGDIATRPPRARTSKNAKQCYRKFDDSDPEAIRRRRATANRLWTILRGALNKGFRDKKIGSDAEWRRVRPFKDVDKARADYLENAAATRLLNGCSPDFRLLVHGALQTGCRFSELARLIAGDFHVAERVSKDGKREEIGTVTIKQSKHKSRHVLLTDEGIRLFRRWTAGRNNGDLIFQNNGLPWKSTQRPMAEACKRARIEPAVSFHVLRHTWASLAIMGGVPLMVIARNLGHRDTRMLERHYGHLSRFYEADQIQSGAPRYGVEPDNVATIR